MGTEFHSLVSWPAGGVGDGDAKTAGGERHGLLALNDIYATVAEILNRPLPPTTGDGRGAEDSLSQLTAMRGDSAPPRAPLYPNDHKEASRQLADERAWVAVRSNATPIAGQWKLFLDHRYAFYGQIHPQELYNLATDPLESKNVIDDPAARPAMEYLIERAQRAAGDDGFSR